MEILLWLLPALVVTLVAMAWAGWAGHADRGRVDHDEALRRMAEVLEQEPKVTHRVEPVRRERSTGVAVRRRADESVESVESVEEHVEERRAS